ncbi:helix-hairpin-helix domain-containing protein [uncultured Rhodoblastus sp.]|uniref:helix-hairpin-helix domain-containing protein n=1 Tax=uncultured Rhodoblastus sp. TaxID=543037 RepID=UPI0025EC50A2|nr:helix-hairpin-helix domain-containing protein [uncultured Rhodoblastus sp.]
MTTKPCRLVRDIRGIAFRTADAIAMKPGMIRESPPRMRAGISFAGAGSCRRGALRSAGG